MKDGSGQSAVGSREEIEALRARIAWLEGLINTPETADFLKGVQHEAAHQIERWGPDYDYGKSPWDWFWSLGYLGQKAAAAALAGDVEKAKHHTITSAALLFNWHRRLSGWDGRS